MEDNNLERMGAALASNLNLIAKASGGITHLLTKDGWLTKSALAAYTKKIVGEYSNDLEIMDVCPNCGTRELLCGWPSKCTSGGHND